MESNSEQFQPTYLTSEGQKKIQEKLEKLKSERPQIAARINAAKEMGDLAENTEYTTAKEEQSRIESEINRLENLLRTAQIVEKDNEGVVGIGTEIILKSNNKTYKYILVGPEEVNLEEGKISYESPLGKSLINKRQGEEVESSTPKGRVKYKITEIK